jgi:hypothetical protein
MSKEVQDAVGFAVMLIGYPLIIMTAIRAIRFGNENQQMYGVLVLIVFLFVVPGFFVYAYAEWKMNVFHEFYNVFRNAF